MYEIMKEGSIHNISRNQTRPTGHPGGHSGLENVLLLQFPDYGQGLFGLCPFGAWLECRRFKEKLFVLEPLRT